MQNEENNEASSSSEARMLVDEIIEMIKLRRFEVDASAEFLKRLERVGIKIVPMLEEKLISSDSYECAVSACYLCAISERMSNSVAHDTLDTASTVLKKCLTDKDVELRLLVAVLLAFFSPPRELLPALVKHLDDPDNRVQAAIASAIAGFDDLREEDRVNVIAKLSGSAENEHPLPKALANAGFARLNTRKELIDEIAYTLRTTDTENRYALLQILKCIGTRAHQAYDAVEEIIVDESNSSALRQSAIRTAGAITKGTDKAHALMTKSFRTHDLSMFEAALEGCAILEWYPRIATKILQKLLSSKSLESRRLAVKGIRLMKGFAIDLADALIDVARAEKKLDVLEEMTNALGAIGEGAIPKLLALCETNDRDAVEIGIGGLMASGSEGAVAMAQVLGSEASSRCGNAILLAMRHMGGKVAPAAPLLISYLEHANSTETVTNLIFALTCCGPAAVDATPLLIDWLIKGDEETRYWAERALLQIGHVAAPFIDAKMEGMPDWKQARLRRLRRNFDPAEQKSASRLERLNCDDVLEAFVIVAECLEGDKSLQWKKIHEEYKDRMTRLGHKVRSERWLADSIKQLSDDLKVLLTTHGHGQKGGGMLTEEGKQLWNEAKQYLMAKRERLGH